jgi:prolyl-tRNA synthetase
MTVRDRKRSGFILSPTHEEEITNLVSDMTNSYKDFPLRLYQICELMNSLDQRHILIHIARKYRDELRPRQGLLRTKEFMMKDLYTFDVSETAALKTYQTVRAVYRQFFDTLGVPYVEVEASSGNMGGSLSHEYHFLSPLGEDTIIICESCGFAANEEILEKKPEGQDHHQCPRCTGHKISTHRAIEVGHTFHLGTRYTEPLNALVTVPKTAQTPEPSPEESQNQGPNITPNDSSTERLPLQMGCHGIGVSRLVGAVAAMTANEKGLSWPLLMAPAHVIVVFDGPMPPTNPDFPTLHNDYMEFRDRLGDIAFSTMWGKLHATSIVFDDRDKPLPWKLKDADLVGYPIIVVVGKHFRESGQYEIQCRSSSKLSVISEDLTTSVAAIMTALAERSGTEVKVKLGKSISHLTGREKAVLIAQRQQSKILTSKAKDKAVGVETGERSDDSAPNTSLEHEMNDKETSEATAQGKSDPSSIISYTRPSRCPECGNKRKL